MKKHIGEHKEQMKEVREQRSSKMAASCKGVLASEKGTVMLLTLVLSAVAIMVTAALIVMVTTATQISGKQARYKDSRSAAKGCADLFIELIGTRADPLEQASFVTMMQTTVDPGFTLTTPATCTATYQGRTYANLGTKLMVPPSSWPAACNENKPIDPAVSATYDMTMVIGTTTTYRCYAKVYSSTEGNTGTGGPWRVVGVVQQGSGGGKGVVMPYYYAIEVLAQPTNFDPAHAERSRLSALYQF